MMDDGRQSHRSIVPTNPSNKARGPVAETEEGRELAKGNSPERNASRTQGRVDAPSALERVRRAAQRDRKQRFTTLFHHVYDVERLRTAYYALKREAAPGVDGETWQHYGQTLEANLHDLAARLKRGAYRAKPVRRAYIAKTDGRQRPLGVPALEDKIVQRAVVAVLNAVYETGFLGFSYGFRPGRSPHQALDALSVAILTKKVNWVGAYLQSVVRGHLAYYGVPRNTPALNAFRQAVGRVWRRMLTRRSQRASVSWTRMRRLIARWLPPVRVCHPYPLVRFGVRT